MQECTHERSTHAQELATAVSMGLDLTVVILNDNAYGMIKWKQVGLHDRLGCWLVWEEALKPLTWTTDVLDAVAAMCMSKGEGTEL